MFDEAFGEDNRTIIAHHPPDQWLEHLGVLQLVLRGKVGQELVGQATPKEVRQPRGEGVLARLGAEEKAGRDQSGADGEEDCGLEVLSLTLRTAEKFEIRSDIRIVDGTSEGARQKGRQDAPCSLVGGYAGAWLGDEDALAALEFLGSKVGGKLGGLEVFFAMQGRQEESLGCVVEALAASAVSRKGVADVEVYVE